MAESKSEVAQATNTQAPHAPRAPRAASAREVLAARIRTAELTGVLSPKCNAVSTVLRLISKR